MTNQLNIQDAFLNKARIKKILLSVFLVNGFQFKGFVKAFDNFTVILESDSKQHLVYKHAISTIIPAITIDILDDEESGSK